MCFFSLPASEHIFSLHGGAFWVKSPQEVKISSKMAFSGGKYAFFDFESKNVPQDASKCRFNDGKMIFGQTLLVVDQFGCVLSISELRNAF